MSRVLDSSRDRGETPSHHDKIVQHLDESLSWQSERCQRGADDHSIGYDGEYWDPGNFGQAEVDHVYLIATGSNAYDKIIGYYITLNEDSTFRFTLNLSLEVVGRHPMGVNRDFGLAR